MTQNEPARPGRRYRHQTRDAHRPRPGHRHALELEHRADR